MTNAEERCVPSLLKVLKETPDTLYFNGQKYGPWEGYTFGFVGDYLVGSAGLVGSDAYHYAILETLQSYRDEVMDGVDEDDPQLIRNALGKMYQSPANLEFFLPFGEVMEYGSDSDLRNLALGIYNLPDRGEGRDVLTPAGRYFHTPRVATFWVHQPSDISQGQMEALARWLNDRHGESDPGNVAVETLAYDQEGGSDPEVLPTLGELMGGPGRSGGSADNPNREDSDRVLGEDEDGVYYLWEDLVKYWSIPSVNAEFVGIKHRTGSKSIKANTAGELRDFVAAFLLYLRHTEEKLELTNYRSNPSIAREEVRYLEKRFNVAKPERVFFGSEGFWIAHGNEWGMELRNIISLTFKALDSLRLRHVPLGYQSYIFPMRAVEKAADEAAAHLQHTAEMGGEYSFLDKGLLRFVRQVRSAPDLFGDRIEGDAPSPSERQKKLLDRIFASAGIKKGSREHSQVMDLVTSAPAAGKLDRKMSPSRVEAMQRAIAKAHVRQFDQMSPEEMMLYQQWKRSLPVGSRKIQKLATAAGFNTSAEFNFLRRTGLGDSENDRSLLPVLKEASVG